MADTIKDGSGRGFLARVTSGLRLTTFAVTEPLSAERSRKGKLWGVGTGNLSLPTSFSGPALWLQNDSNDHLLYVQKLIFGWNGGTSSRNTTLFSLINYNTTVPTAANTAIDAAIENVSRSGSTTAVTLDDFSAHKWDNATGTAGMTGSSAGFAQIPNRLAIGNTSIPIDGEIVLGRGNSMRLDLTPDEAGEANVAVVFYTALAEGVEAE